MVYAALAWALTAGNATDGAKLMVALGLGTLPMLPAPERRRALVESIPATAVGAGGARGCSGFCSASYTLFAPGGHKSHGGGHTGHAAGFHFTAYD